ncbi:MAG: hypothetical protein WDZ80_07225 [Candidatus Paceibacterota bacterium]
MAQEKKISLDISRFDLNQLSELDVKGAIAKIKGKRKQNQKALDDHYKRASDLNSKGESEKALELIQGGAVSDILSYSSVTDKAYKLETAGKLEQAAKVYWINIYENGSDLPYNFKRLMIILSKLKRKKEELTVAKINCAFVSDSYREKIEKRISNIEKKIKKQERV